MNEKEFVGLEQGVCPICRAVHETGTVMIHKGLKKVFPSHGKCPPSCFHLCNDCEEMGKKGYVALVGVSNAGDGVTPENAEHTSEYLWLKRFVAEQIIDTDLSEFTFAYIEPQAIESIKEIVARNEPKHLNGKEHKGNGCGA